jgi:peptidoglycan/LPS O-acetylase OafA/YrhL
MKAFAGNNFSLIRILAAILVVFSHSYALTGNIEPAFLGISIGTWAVYTFFIISGFLLTKRSNFSIIFFWKRCLRIFPGLILVIFLTVFILGPLVTNLKLNEYFKNKETWSYLIHLGLFVDRLPGVFENNPFPNSVNGSLWMLPYLFLMYAILFLYGNLNFLNRKYIIVILYALALVICAIQPIILFFMKSIIFTNTSLTADSNTVPQVTYHIIPTLHDIVFTIGGIIISLNFWKFYLCFFGGVILALYEDIKIDYKILTLFVFIAIFTYIEIPSLATYIILIVMPCFVIKFALSKNHILNSLSPYIDISYGIYICSFPIQQAIAQYRGNNLVPFEMFLMAISFAFAFAVMSWYFVELPARKFEMGTQS